MQDLETYSRYIREYEEKIMRISSATEDDIKNMRRAIRAKMKKDRRSMNDYCFAYLTIKKIYDAMWSKGMTLSKATAYVLNVL